MWQGILSHEKCRADIATNMFIEHFYRHIVGFGISQQHASIVNQNIQFAVALDSRVHASTSCRFI